MKYYINNHGIKTSKKIDSIIDQAWKFMNDGSNSSWSKKMNTKKMLSLRFRFENEVEKIGGVDYEFGDCLC